MPTPADMPGFVAVIHLFWRDIAPLIAARAKRPWPAQSLVPAVGIHPLTRTREFLAARLDGQIVVQPREVYVAICEEVERRFPRVARRTVKLLRQGNEAGHVILYLVRYSRLPVCPQCGRPAGKPVTSSHQELYWWQADGGGFDLLHQCQSCASFFRWDYSQGRRQGQPHP